MSTKYGPKIVTNGLVLYLDAGDSKSYSGAGIYWYDLTNNHYNSTLSGEVSYLNNSLSFDGTNGVVSLSDVSIGTQWTIDTALNYNYNTKQWEFFLGTLAANGSIGKILLSNDGFVTYSFPVGVYNHFQTSSSSISLRNTHLTFISSGTEVKLYINGLLLPGNILSIINAPFNLTTIGNAWSDNVWQSQFNLYFLKLYNRALSSLEIQQNYNATKSRFGL